MTESGREIKKNKKRKKMGGKTNKIEREKVEAALFLALFLAFPLVLLGLLFGQRAREKK